MKLNSIPLLFLSLIVLIRSQEINLTRFSQTPHSTQIIHTIPVQIGKQQFKVALYLNQSLSWIKSSKCLICKEGKCRQACDGNIGLAEAGLICAKGYCNDTQKQYKDSDIQGIQLTVVSKIGNRNFSNTSIVSAEKIKFETNVSNKQYDGVFGLLNNKAIIKSFSLASKDKTMKIILKDQLPKEYLDSKQSTITESLQDDYSFKVSGFSLDNETVYIQYRTYINLNKRSLVLPEPCYQQVKNKLKYLIPECQIQINKIICQNSKSLNVAKDLVVGMQLENHKLQIPLSSLTDNCKTKQCDLLIEQTKQMKMLLGEGFLLNFAVNYNLPEKYIKFHRLSNVHSTKYHQIIKVKGQLQTQHQQFPRTASGFIWHFIRIAFKIGIVIGLYYFMLQFYLNYKEIVERIKIFLAQKQYLYRSPYTQANQDEFYNGGSLMGSDAQAAAKQFWEDNAIEGI